MHLVVAAALIVACMPVWCQANIELKGISLGKSPLASVAAQWKGANEYGSAVLVIPNNHANALCGRLALDGSNYKCRSAAIDSLRLAGGAAGDYWFHSVNQVIESASCDFHRTSFSLVKGALFEKYGAATSIRSATVKTRRGAEFSGEVLEWKLDSGTITLHEIGETIDKSLLSMKTKTYQEHQEQKAKEKQKDGAARL